MKKRIVLSVIATALLVATAEPTTVGLAASNAASIEKINQEIAKIKQKEKAQKQQLSSVKSQIKNVQQKKEDLEDQLMAIDLRRDETQKKLDKLEKQIDETEQKAVEAQQQLDEAQERVDKRENLLKTRVKSMYERGSISYLEVLLGSSDFGDFLTRMDALRLILDQDTRILEDNIKDKETIAQKKKEVDEHLASYSKMYAEAENLKAQLDQQYKESMVVKAQLEKQEEELQEIAEEEEQQLLAIANERAAKVAELSRLQSVSNYKGGKLAYPIPPGNYRISSGFGLRKDPFTGRSAGHNGLDMAAPRGTAIHAAADGIVIVAGYVNGFGNTVMIKHDSHITTLYGHIREGGIMVKVGQFVKAGDKIAEVGMTGRATGNHLHFTVYKDNVAVDPNLYLP
ncbi:murein hydrolase activator EnvC family protein [Brevibacillus fulvus]|uniref:Murein DD-endopeptidase MepM/ murein hydrolase activator NlpD n=1 Tax=Brevibacillus fulvus TaxID=1125967 RepID=A0A939BVG6_9BACL|nr:peptidoglycan DD-metalloendopeptidase family protein [Brevibacillus fulvus]MBM7591454.1 murein DD-endopeptidase MepM/ murein hydrolase activator NlpD [Brevibacillus fulvus]